MSYNLICIFFNMSWIPPNHKIIFDIFYVSAVIDSGSRYEVAYPGGISHFLEKLAFNVSNYLNSLVINHVTLRSE